MIITDHPEIVAKVSQMRGYLVGFEWPVFGTTAQLRICDDISSTTHSGTLKLDGVHLLMTRQSMMCKQFYNPPSLAMREDWDINYFEILPDSPFLTAFLQKGLGLQTDVVLYDAKRVEIRPDTGRKPVHVSMCTGGGHLDVVCEEICFEM